MHLLLTLIYFLLVATGNCCFVQGLQHPTHGYRRQMNQMRTLAQWAYQHGMRINEEAMCSKPRAELVYLKDNNKIYLPRATLLHRCSDVTGCCAHATHACMASQEETVSLYFFTISVQSLSRLRQNQNIEKISFVNHTECACMPMPLDHGRSESLVRQNESAVENSSKVNTATREQPILESTDDRVSGDDARAVVYSGDMMRPENSENNLIDIHNGMTENEDSPLQYWGKLMGMYKTKVSRNDDLPDDTVAKKGKVYSAASPVGFRQSPARKRLDSFTSMHRPLPSPAPLSSVPVLNGHPFVPYQSQYMYMYPPVHSRYSLINRLHAPLTKRETSHAKDYQLTYRRIH